MVRRIEVCRSAFPIGGGEAGGGSWRAWGGLRGGAVRVEGEEARRDEQRARGGEKNNAAQPLNALAHALIKEAVHLGDLSSLMVASEQRDPGRVAKLQREEKTDALHGEVTAVDVVTHEEQAAERRRPCDSEELKKIVDLAMDITTHSDGRLYRRNRLLLRQHRLRLVAQLCDVVLRQLLPLLKPRLHLDDRRTLVRQRYGLLGPSDNFCLHAWEGKERARVEEMIDGGAGSDEREEEYDRRVVSFGLNVRNLSERKRKKHEHRESGDE